MLKAPQLDETAPWKARFRAPSILWTQLAQGAPTRGLVASNRSGIYQLYAWDVLTGQLHPVTDRPTGTRTGTLAPDGRYVYYLDDAQGNEIGHFVRVPFSGGPREDLTLDLPAYEAEGPAVSRTGRLLGFTIADPNGFHLCCIPLDPQGAAGSPRLLYHSPAYTFGPALSHDGELAVLYSTEGTGPRWFKLLAIDTATGQPVAELWDGPGSSLEFAAFSPRAGDFRVMAISNRSGVNRPLIWDPRTGMRTDLRVDSLAGEVVPLDWSPDAGQVLLAQVHAATQKLYLYDLAHDGLTPLAHPGGAYGIVGVVGWRAAYFAPEGAIFAHWQDSTHPPRLIALDPTGGAQTRTVLSAGEAPPGHPWRLVTFSSSDGQAIQGWLATPDGAGPFPAILHVHGGPSFAINDVFLPSSQAWLDHGFAYLTINYRGSTTFGRAFEEQIRGDLGHWEVEDMVAARAWLVAQGIAQPAAILVTGGSYGGYLTLLVLGKRPELWAGGIALVAMADCVLTYEDELDSLKADDAALFGGTPAENPAQWATSSPSTYADRVRAPILVIQGRNDPRCPPRQMEVYAAKMRALGKTIAVHWFDAGHGSLAMAEAIHHQELQLEFAYQILGAQAAT